MCKYFFFNFESLKVTNERFEGTLTFSQAKHTVLYMESDPRTLDSAGNLNTRPFSCLSSLKRTEFSDITTCSGLSTIWNNMYLYQSINSQDFQQFGTAYTSISQSTVRTFNNLEQHVLVSVNQQSGLSTIWNNMYLYQSISSQDCQQFGNT